MLHMFTPNPPRGCKAKTGFRGSPRLFPGYGAVIFLIFVLAFSGRVGAQADFYARLWQAENGLPNNIVQAITQTTDGYLWVGTREGLCRFDGEQFDLIHLMPQTMELSINYLLAAQDGSLWIGTDGRGIFRIFRGEVQRWQIPGLSINTSIFRICEASDHSIWIDTGYNLSKWKNGKMESYEQLLANKKLAGELDSGKKPICADNAGNIWLFNGNLIRADLAKATNYFATPGQLPHSARTLYRDNEGVFWVGTDSSSSNILIKIKDGTITKYQRQSGPSGFPQVIFRDSARNLWVGSYEGLSRMVDDKFVAFTTSDDFALSLSCKIYAIIEDREHNLWIGSDGGLTRLTPKRFKSITKKDGLASNVALAVCASREDGGVWISSWGSGLSHYVDGKMEVLNTSNGLPSNFIMALAETRDGSLWTGVDYNGPLLRIKNGKVTVYEHKGHHGTPALYEDERGVLWIGNRGYLQTWDGTNFNRFTRRNGFGSDEVNAICGGEKGSVWFGTIDGLMRWQNGKFENLAVTNPQLHVLILSLYQDADKTLWIGTRGQGLLRWRDGQVNKIDHTHGLFNDSIYAILEDGHTNLWFNSSRGIFRVDKRQIQAVAEGRKMTIASVNYGVADGVLGSGQYFDATQPAACKDRLGRLWFRTTQGVTMVSPQTAMVNNQPPPIVFQEIIADNKPVSVGKVGLPIPKTLTIPPGHGVLEIRYAALSYQDSERDLYRYKLTGVDADWVDAGNRRVAKYTKLPPGQYLFEVIARNNDGIWNNQGTSVELVLEPHFWQTWWFYSLLGMAATGSIAGTVRYITRQRMEKKLQQLEKQRAVEEERARIARDVHDELGAKLTSISFQGGIAKYSVGNPSEIVKQIEQMSESAREAVSSLHTIVWAVDSHNDSLEGLIGYISEQVGELFTESSIHCEVLVPETIPPLPLSAAVRHNLFLATMEAANNIAKHSNATQATIKFLLHPDTLEVVVSDNGKGFDASSLDNPRDKSKHSGNGLTNMRRRLTLIGGQCKINSEKNEGLTICFQVPLNAGPA